MEIPWQKFTAPDQKLTGEAWYLPSDNFYTTKTLVSHRQLMTACGSSVGHQ